MISGGALWRALFLTALLARSAGGEELPAPLDVPSLEAQVPLEVSAKPEKRYFAGIAVLGHNLGRYSTQDTGSTSLIASVFPQLSFAGYFHLRETSWGFSPIFNFTPFAPIATLNFMAHSSPEGGERTALYNFGFRGLRTVGALQNLDLIFGVGLMNVAVSGSGKTVTLNNGNSTTIFGTPADTATASLFYWELGASFRFPLFIRGDGAPELIRWENSLLMTDGLSARRAVSVSTQLSYGVF